ncbi:DUF881 domain-containing protein [Brachybacterium aquaticum]|uniref:Uncharacterized protein YlxW (UPF0749 family) n=1 Tax=Brachybacterium aquaticum TaxID=1432564 RepID=A0A841AC29_9MICO|nr:DUF881 domain-containing protein [Brachybacterium aquaticum]MBB5831497.1 uncharacterized protein YlxW (UPF0749 family) [Brachybacterium aquaticum]
MSTRPGKLREEHPTPHGETPYSPTSLLRALTADPYSVDDLREQEHPAGEATPPDNRATRTITLLLALLLGFVVSAAVVDLRYDAAAEDSPRALLEQEVRDTRAEADQLEERQGELEAQIAEAQGVVLDGTDDRSAEELAAHEQAGAAVAMTGPGIDLVLDDSAPLPSSPGAGPGAVNRVTDADVQIAVNGLWAAGAEAIAVNGQRVSSTTAIRTAGSAVLVDFRPLSPPYRITALGDPEQLRTGVEDSESGEYLADISSRYGIQLAWEPGEELTLPARAVGTLREATVPGAEPEPAPETPPTTAPDDPLTRQPDSAAATTGPDQEDPL